MEALPPGRREPPRPPYRGREALTDGRAAVHFVLEIVEGGGGDAASIDEVPDRIEQRFEGLPAHGFRQ